MALFEKAVKKQNFWIDDMGGGKKDTEDFVYC